MKQHTSPCPGCPWRKKSLEGWLGSWTPEKILMAAQSEEFMPCHIQVDYEKGDWQDNQYDKSECAGRANFRANQGAPFYNKLRLQGKKDKTVFSTATQFLCHHKSEPKLHMKKKTKSHTKIKTIDFGEIPKDRVEAEIHKLKVLKTFVKHYTLFGEDNWAAINAQIIVLEKRMDMDEVFDYGFNSREEENAREAVDFLEYDVESLTDENGWGGVLA